MHKGFGAVTSLLLAGLFAAAPTSTNYTLKAFDLGGGGGSGSSTNYKLNGSAGTQNAASGSSTSYGLQSGLAPTINSNVPPAPTFTNPSNYYDRLRLVLNIGNNPSDTKFAIAISPDNFTTTRYVKSDQAIGNTLTAADYQTYTAWGGASGFLVLGLQPGTTYTVKVKAMQGNFTETAYSPTASAATVQPTLSFSVQTTLTATPPFTATFTGLSPGIVSNANADIILTMSTNALAGGSVYVKDGSNGLNSSSAGYTLASATADLSLSGTGYGAQVIAASQSAGGPMASVAPYNGTGQNVGLVSTALREIGATTSPVNAGSITVRLKAKTDITVPSRTDYSDTLTFIAAMLF